MNVLEKILEEIDKIKDVIKAPIYDNCFGDECGDNGDCMVCVCEKIMDIIRSHMDDISDTNGEKWIPVDDTEHTPKDESYVLVSFSNSNLPDIARYEENKEGGTYYPGDDEKPYLKYGFFVNAWQPLPEPYKGE